MIQVIPFKPEHLDQIELKENFNQSDCPKTVMNSAFTFTRDGVILAIIGGFPFVPGVIHFWTFLSKYTRKYPIDFQKEVLKMLDWYEANEKPRRMQFEVRSDYGMGCRWAESLGFQREGLMRKWGPDGADHYLYARINPCHK